jgi:MFS family permease
MTRRALIALGIGQCINWGALYYAFALLVVPLQRELGVETWTVTGAFSLALLMSAALAPTVGRWGDRGHGPLVMQLGGFSAAVLLGAWTLLPGIVMLYVVWAGLGLCMAATLYEPAFVIVGRAYDNPTGRLRALAAITIFGGLASTVFLPGTAFLVATFEWRGAVVGLAIALTVSTLLTRQFVFRTLTTRPLANTTPITALVGRPAAHQFRFLIVAGMFTFATLASGAFSTNLVPALGERGVAPTSAALLGGLMGAMQLPGRVLLMNGTLAGSPGILLALSLALHAVGLGLVAFGPVTPIIAAGTTVLALGNGLVTLVRPHLVQTLFSVESGGILNGRIARHQQLARAGGPMLVAWLASRFTYAAVLGLFALTFVIATLIALGALRQERRQAAEDQAA